MLMLFCIVDRIEILERNLVLVTVSNGVYKMHEFHVASIADGRFSD